MNMKIQKKYKNKKRWSSSNEAHALSMLEKTYPKIDTSFFKGLLMSGKIVSTNFADFRRHPDDMR